MAAQLSVNLNKIALLRNSREGNVPDVQAFGRRALEAGAAGLTVHPRPDGRHIRPGDVIALSHLVAQYPGAEFNIEGNPFAPPQGNYPGLMALVESTRPAQVTLVPDADGQLTSDHGFDLHRDGERLRPIVARLQALGARVSVFMDPVLEQIDAVPHLGAERIELYTGPFAAAYQDSHEGAPHQARREAALAPYSVAAQHAETLGVGVNAGHDLALDNLPDFAAALPQLLEVSIGHALTVDALNLGWEAAIAAYLAALEVPSA